MKLVQLFLYPFALIYGMVMAIRNILFDIRILPSVRYEIPVIGIGNLSFGGTGKTPHTEYIIRLLKNTFSVAMLSRGYGRETKGYLLGTKKTNARYVGDEPLQIIRKFETVKVAVDEKRVRGIEHLMNKFPDLDVILLDDAFQHRYVKPGINILLTDYHNIYPEDHVVPAGRLREFACGAKRADIIIVTKTPKVFSPITRRRIIDQIRPHKDQELLFSYIRHMDPKPVFEQPGIVMPPRISYVLMVTGIANDAPLREHVERMCTDLTIMQFQDHHPFSQNDAENIRRRFLDLPTQKKVIITTEKDAMRLRSPETGTILKDLPLFYIPIEADFHGNDKTMFDKMIVDYVARNKRNRRVPAGEHHPAP